MKQTNSNSLVKHLPSSKPALSEVMTVVYEQNIAPLVVGHPLPLDKKINRFLKRTFDLAVSFVLLLLVFSWLLPLMAILIRLDSRGPVFFLQKRNSRNGKLFTCIKFRTMVVNDHADSMPAQAFDTRITGIGKFLRRNHLDELPQLLNVFLGHMSLIGPRPHMVSDNRKYEELLNFYSYRHKVKPGLTGLAQVYGHIGVVSDLADMKERVKKDIYYIHHWSFLLDLRIIALTLLNIITRKKESAAGS